MLLSVQLDMIPYPPTAEKWSPAFVLPAHVFFVTGQSSADRIERPMKREGRKDSEGVGEDLDGLPAAEINNILFSSDLDISVPPPKNLSECVPSWTLWSWSGVEEADTSSDLEAAEMNSQRGEAKIPHYKRAMDLKILPNQSTLFAKFMVQYIS